VKLLTLPSGDGAAYKASRQHDGSCHELMMIVQAASAGKAGWQNLVSLCASCDNDSTLASASYGLQRGTDTHFEMIRCTALTGKQDFELLRKSCTRDHG